MISTEDDRSRDDALGNGVVEGTSDLHTTLTISVEDTSLGTDDLQMTSRREDLPSCSHQRA